MFKIFVSLIPQIANTEAAKEHAKWFAQTLRPWANSTFYSALSEERSDGERKEIVDLFYKRLEDLIAQAPGDYGVYYIHGYMHIRKIKE